MTDEKKASLINALDLAVLFLAALSVSLRPLVCGEGTRYTLLGLLDAPVVNLLVSLPFLFALFLWLPRMALAGELRLTRTGMAIPICLFVLFVIRSVFISHYEWRSAMTALYWIGQILLFVLLVHNLDSPKKLRLIVACVVASALIVALFALLQRVILFPALIEQYRLDPTGTARSAGVTPENMPDFRSRLETLRVTGTFLLPTTYAGFLCLVIPLQIGLFIDNRKSRIVTFGMGAAILLQLVVLFLTKSKGGWITLAFGMLLFTALWGRSLVWRRKKIVGLCLALFVAIFALAQWRGKLPPASRYVDSFLVRAQYWRAGMEMIRDHPFSGIGLNEYGDLHTAYKRPEDDETQMAHNNFIQLWAETGLFGLLSFCGIWAVFLIRHFRRCRHLPPGGNEPTEGEKQDIELVAVGLIVGTLTIALASFVFMSLPLIPPGMYPTLFLEIAGSAVLLIAWSALFVLAYANFFVAPFVPVVGPMTQRGVWIGVICFLVHSLVDFDLYETGVAQTLWMLAAIGLANPAPEQRLVKPLGAPARVALAGGAFAATVIVLLSLWPTVLFGGVHLANGQTFLEDDEPNTDKAIAEFRKAADYSPQNALPHEWLGVIFRNLWHNQHIEYGGEPTLHLAIKHFERAAELNPRKARYHFELAELLRSGASNRSMQKRAAEEYEKAVACFPVKPLYLACLGFMYEELKKPKPLVEDTFRRALYMDEHAGRRYNKLSEETRKKIKRRLGDITPPE